jgi:hypothetical protein
LAGFIVLSDGRAYAASNWAYDQTVDAIASALPESHEGKALSHWLLEQKISSKGVGNIDVRELAPHTNALFITAVKAALAATKDNFIESEAQKDWHNRFIDLLAMIESIERGEAPQAFNPHMLDILPPTGEKAGPGWDLESDKRL